MEERGRGKQGIHIFGYLVVLSNLLCSGYVTVSELSDSLSVQCHDLKQREGRSLRENNLRDRQKYFEIC